ncbi:MAG: HNH endonuclease [Candidatus Rhabdochlamydia sp.]
MIKINRPICPNTGSLASGNYKHPDNKAALLEVSHNKCVYCESIFSHVDFGDVEHIKPKSKYPQETFVWENLGIVCRRCNHEKSDKYDESAPYINPYSEDPEDHIAIFGSILSQKKGSERGQLTILDIGLNRLDLIEKRKQKQNDIEKAISDCFKTKNQKLKAAAIKSLLEEATSDKEYSLLIKTLFKVHSLL